MPAAMGSRLSMLTRPSVRIRIGGGEGLERRIDEIVAGDGGRVRTRHGDGRCTARLERHPVTDAGEDDEAFEQMIAVGAAAEHAQRQVDLGACALCDCRHRPQLKSNGPEEKLFEAAW